MPPLHMAISKEPGTEGQERDEEGWGTEGGPEREGTFSSTSQEGGRGWDPSMQEGEALRREATFLFTGVKRQASWRGGRTDRGKTRGFHPLAPIFSGK